MCRIVCVVKGIGTVKRGRYHLQTHVFSIHLVTKDDRVES